MVSVSTNFRNAYNSGAEQDIVLTFEDGSVIGKSDISITSGGLTISEYLNSDEDYTIGAASMAELKVTLINKDGKFDGFNFAQKFTLRFGVKVGDAFEYMPFGYWVGERPGKVKSRLIQFTAYDAMKMLDIPAEEFILGLTFPVTFGDLYTKLMTYARIPVYITSRPIEFAKTFERNPFDSTDYSCREILAIISEASGGHARIRYYKNTRCMALSVSRFSAVNYTINRTGRFELSVSDFPTPSISKLEVYTSYSDMLTTAGTGSNTYVIADNPLLYIENDTEVAGFQPYVNALYSELSAFPTYYPASVRAVGVPWLECGDIIKVIDDNDNALDFPIFAKTMTWNGSWTMELENSGGVVRQVLPIEQRELQNLKKKMLRTTDLYTKIDSYLSTEEGIASITSAVGGKFVTQDDISGFVTESQLDASIEQYINGAEGTAAIVSAVSGQFMEKPVEPVYSTPSGVTYGFTKTADGYYTSTNAGVANSYSYGKFTFNSNKAQTVTLRCISYGENNFDYGLISTLNANLAQSNTADTSNVLYNFYGKASADPVDISLDIPEGESFITFKYRKDNSTNSNGDYFKIMVVSGFATTAEVSATIKQSISQFEASISLVATTGADGNTSALTLKSGETTLSSANITFSGFVKFTDLSTAGSTTINGANVTTDNLYLKNVYYDADTSYLILSSHQVDTDALAVQVGMIESIRATQHLELYGDQIWFIPAGSSRGDMFDLIVDIQRTSILPVEGGMWWLGNNSVPFSGTVAYQYSFPDGSYLTVTSTGRLRFYDSSGDYTNLT